MALIMMRFLTGVVLVTKIKVYLRVVLIAFSLVLTQACESEETSLYHLECHGVTVTLPSDLVIKRTKSRLDDLNLDSSECSARFKMKGIKLSNQYEKTLGGILDIFENPQTVIDNKKSKNDLTKTATLRPTTMKYINDDFKVYVDDGEFGFGNLLYIKENDKLSYVGGCSEIHKDHILCSMSLLIGNVLVDYSLINESITKANIESINEYLLSTIMVSESKNNNLD